MGDVVPLIAKFEPLGSYDDEERKQHYDAIKADLSVAEENMDSLVKGTASKNRETMKVYIAAHQ